MTEVVHADPNSSGLAAVKLFAADSSTALSQQLTSIFCNIAATLESRPRRLRECLDALRDTLFNHAEEIGERKNLQDLLLTLVQDAFSVSLHKGCACFRVVFDFKWRDQHEKRSRFFVLLLERALMCRTAEECAFVTACQGELLRENVRTTTDIFSDHLEPLVKGLIGADTQRCSVMCEVLSTIIDTMASVIKCNPTLLEILTVSCSPLNVLKQALETTDEWHQTALIGVVTSLIEENCIEVTQSMEDSIAALLNHQLRHCSSETQLWAVLEALIHIAPLPAFQSASWDTEAMVCFLSETKWGQCSLKTKCAAVSAIGKVLTLFCASNPAAYDLLSNQLYEMSLGEDEEVVLCVLKVLGVILASPTGLKYIDRCVVLICYSIRRLNHIPLAYDILETIRNQHGTEQLGPVYELLDEYVNTKEENLNFAKLNAMLRFMGDAAPVEHPGIRRLRISLHPSRDEPVLIRSLSLATTLNRVDQMKEALLLLAHDETNVRKAALTAVIQLSKSLLYINGEASEFNASTSTLTGGEIRSKVEALTGGDAARAGSVGASNPLPGISILSRKLDTDVCETVERVLDVAVADPSPELRLAALQSLGPEFYSYLCLQDNLDALFMARNDVDQASSEQSLVLLCKLYPFNPATVKPELQASQEFMLRDVSNREGSLSLANYKARLLATCAQHGALLLPTKTVESVALSRLEAEPFVCKSLSMGLLHLLNTVMQHTGPRNHVEFAQYLGPLLTIVNGGDSSQRRRRALETLATAITSLPQRDASLVTEVYRSVARIIRWETEEEDSVTIAAMCVISALGAADPIKIRKVLQLVNSDEIEEDEEVVASSLAHLKPHLHVAPTQPASYSSLMMYFLVKALQHSLDAKQQVETLGTVQTMLQGCIPVEQATLLVQLLPQLQIWLQDSDRAYLYERVLALMNELALLLRGCKDSIPSSTALSLLTSMHQFCQQPQASQKPFSQSVVLILDNLAKAIPAQEIRSHRWAVEFIHQRLSQDKSDLELIHSVLRALESFLGAMHETDLQLILPHVLECVEPSKANVTSRQPKLKGINDSCFDFLTNVMAKQPNLVKDCSAQIVHTVLWYIQLSDSKEEMEQGFYTLACLVTVVQASARRFLPQIERTAEKNGYSSAYFQEMLQSVSRGTRRRGSYLDANDLCADQIISVTSHLPRLSQNDFEAEMRTNLKLGSESFEVIDTSHPSGQTIVNFRFSNIPSRDASFALFSRKALDSKSSLRRNLGILKVEQSQEEPRAVDLQLIRQITEIPSAKNTKREQSWILWVHNTTVALLRNSPYPSMRCASSVVDRNSDLSKDLFSFAAIAVLGMLNTSDRQQLVDTFTQALAIAPTDTKQSLFTLAEFLESERGCNKTQVVKVKKQKIFSVARETGAEKFGINYDQDPSRGVCVTKLATNGLGAKAGVPIGAQLLEINGKSVRAVSDIRAMIDGLTRIDLLLAYEVQEKREPVQKPQINLETLAQVSFQSQLHAKAIYFNEVLFEELSKSSFSGASDRKNSFLRRILHTAEDLIEFYGHLNLTAAANGLLSSLRRRFSDNIIAPDQFGFDEIASLEQLHWWNEALIRYKSRLGGSVEGGVDMVAFLGALRCEQALGHTNKVRDLIDDYWEALSTDDREKVLPFRASAAFTLGLWDEFDALSETKSGLKNFQLVEQCAALFRKEKYDELLHLISGSRQDMMGPFADSMNESYNRAYDLLVQLQHLRHFEELVLYRDAGVERRDHLKEVWGQRLHGMSPKPSNIVTMVAINSLVLAPEEDLPSYVYAIRTLSKFNWMSQAEHLLMQALGPECTMEELCQQKPELIHAYMKYLYATEGKRETYTQLKEILHDSGVEPGAPGAEMWGNCWLLLGEWTMSLFADCGDEAIDELLCATELSPNNSAAFHSLGILHYDLARDPTTPPDVKLDHHMACVVALFKAVQLATENGQSHPMHDILRILTVWFAHSDERKINETVHHGIQIVPDYVWLSVIPQLIARIGITARDARTILIDLLIRVGSSYPQALIYPLTVAERSPDTVRSRVAEKALAGIRSVNDNNQVVEEASLISNEMVRIAILWTEKWHAGIQQAAHKPDNAALIKKILSPLYKELDHATTPGERGFERNFGQALRRGKSALDENQLDKMWSFLKQVYVQLTKMIGERRLYMAEVSPILDGMNDSIVAVPGTFEHGKAPITIQKFHSRVYVMPSKQKPRRMGLDASDGKSYRFLLKGHEDMRQDERVMQFIGLINTIFLSDNATSAIGLVIPQYAVIPLTDNVGIIGWVENTETIYKMLETYRKSHNVSIYEEVNYIMKTGSLQNIEEYHRLSKQHRKALLSDAMENTPDDELRRIVWERNDTCDQWLRYRQSYGQTLAAMSMVGYVLGLGDRHLNNLMLQEHGMVVHIDFGDCFEVAMHRALYAEAVPFRLTRLLIKALGVTGVDGVFRLTCELAMKNLRRHSENLLSILEAFIYDPLINWRLNVGGEVYDRSGTKGDSNSPSADPRSQPDGAGRGVESARQRSLLGEEDPESPLPMQLSRSVAKNTYPHSPCATSGGVDGGEEETRNEQGDLALARVQAKLTGQDFGGVNTSFSMMRNSRRNDFAGSSWSSSSGVNFHESPKDSFAGPLLTTYLSLRVISGGVDTLDVQHQVDRLIQEATSLDNLSDAYLTGWSPFW